MSQRPTPSPPPESEARQERLQVQLLLALVLGAGGSVSEDLLQTFDLAEAASVASIVGVAGWVGVLWVFFRMWQHGTLDREGQYMRGVVDDERVKSIRLQAVYFAFVAVMTLQLGLELVSAVLVIQDGPALGARLAANLTFATGLIASLGSFLYLDRYR